MTHRIVDTDNAIVAYGVEGYEWLVDRAANTYSQFGEDGIVDAIFGRIGTANRWCFECGASDGVFFSNTGRLSDDGWECVMVESDRDKYDSLTMRRPLAHNVYAKIGTDDWTIDTILKLNGAPLDLDLLVLDIDGQEYWVLHDMKRYTPRVVMVEYECPDMDSPPPDRGEPACKQAGSSWMTQLVESKGYTVVCKTSCNIIAVRSDLADKLSA